MANKKDTTGSEPRQEADEPSRVKRSKSGAKALAQAIYSKPGYLFRRSQQIAVSLFLEQSRALDITPLQYGSMEVVRAYPGIDQSGLGNNLGLDRTTIVGIVDRLERKGWLIRKTSNVDRRMRLLFLTPLGEEQIRQMRPLSDVAQKKMLEPLGDQESKFFLDCLARIVSYHNDASRVPVGGRQRLIDGEAI